MTITEKYDELREKCGKYDRIFIDRGVVDPQGGYFRQPVPDPDHDGEIPRLCIFAVMPKDKEQRLADLAANGWFEFTPEPAPEAVKSKTTKR